MNKLDVLKNCLMTTTECPTTDDLIKLSDDIGDEKVLTIALHILKRSQLEQSECLGLDKKQIEQVNNPESKLDVKTVRAIILIQIYVLAKKHEKLSVNFENLLKVYPGLGNDKKIMLGAVEKDGLYLKYASKELCNDEEVVFKAVEENGSAYTYASQDLQNNPRIKLALQNRRNILSNQEVSKLKSLLQNLSGTEKVLKKSEDIDMRFQINKPDEWPYCLFGFIEANGCEGSGVLVGPNLVLTAAHVIYDNKTNKEEPLDSIYFFPGRNGEQKPFGKVGVKGIVYPTKYQNQAYFPHDQDWAFLILEKDIGNEIAKKKKSGWFQLNALDEKELKNHPISITGYPGEKNRTLFEIKGKIHEIQKDVIGYKLDTSSGQSGGGVWTEIEGEKYLIGVHQGYNELTNWATRWTVERRQIYQRFTEVGINALANFYPNLKITISPNLKINTITDISKIELKEVKVSDIAIAFGKEMWATHLGDIGVEPPLPPDIKEILSAPCPFFPGKKVEETHLLTLIPKTVNRNPLTLQTLGELVKKPLKGIPTQYRYFDIGEYKHLPTESSHWVLMTRDVIPGSREKSYNDQQKVLKGCIEKKQLPYQVPTLLDATTSIFMEFLRSGTFLYSGSPGTYTRCQEKYNKDWQLVVGGFASAGLGVGYDGYDYDVIGVAALRKF